MQRMILGMFDRGITIEDVAQITGLTEAEIQQRYL
jgi:hypothetical protein